MFVYRDVDGANDGREISFGPYKSNKKSWKRRTYFDQFVIGYRGFTFTSEIEEVGNGDYRREAISEEGYLASFLWEGKPDTTLTKLTIDLMDDNKNAFKTIIVEPEDSDYDITINEFSQLAYQSSSRAWDFQFIIEEMRAPCDYTKTESPTSQARKANNLPENHFVWGSADWLVFNRSLKAALAGEDVSNEKVIQHYSLNPDWVKWTDEEKLIFKMAA